MILRRFTKHVTDQNWFAVWLDVIVVVVGIFLGPQVTQWNDGRQDVQWEREFFQDLKGDLERDSQHLGTVIEFQLAKGDRQRATMQQLVSGKTLASDEFAVDYWASRSENNTFFPANGVYQSALTPGKIELVRDKSLRYRIMNLYGHHYTRIAYNGKIYDERFETPAWESRKYFDSFQRQFIRWNDSVLDDIRAEFSFLIRENEFYMGLALTLDEKLRKRISDLDAK